MDHVVTIQLNVIEELFTVVDSDPFKPSSTIESGVDQLAVELRTRSGVPKRVVLLLPPDQVDDQVGDRAQQALRRWCDRAMVLANRELAALRWRGIKALQVGFLALAACLAGAALVEEAFGSASLLSTLFGEGLVIAGWVSLWVPVDILLHQRLQVRQRTRLYRVMRGLTLEVQARPRR